VRTELLCAIRQRVVIIYLAIFWDNLWVPSSRVKKPSQKWRNSTVFRNSWTFQKFPLKFTNWLILNVIYIHSFLSLKYNQQDATFSRSVYFYKLLSMFQAVPPPIIRSTKMYIQRQVLWNQYCCLLLSWMRWIAAGSSIGLTIPDAVCTVLCPWCWAEEPPETCRAIYRNK